MALEEIEGIPTLVYQSFAVEKSPPMQENAVISTIVIETDDSRSASYSNSLLSSLSTGNSAT